MKISNCCGIVVPWNGGFKRICLPDCTKSVALEKRDLFQLETDFADDNSISIFMRKPAFYICTYQLVR